MVIKHMSKKSIKISILNNIILFFTIFSILFTYNLPFALNFNSKRNLSIPTFNEDNYYKSSKLRLLSLSQSFNKNETASYLTLDNKEYYEYYINRVQKKYSNFYEASVETEKKAITAHLPEEFKYRSIDQESLKQYLDSRDSLLCEDPYFSIIINTSKEFNLNPLLLFAIAGQEQSFVPKDSKYALKIANNPYNVFNSWQNYNTDIEDSSKIASRTVINLSKGKPDNIDLFTWINRKYSEDKDWHNGVRSIYDQLKTYSTFFQ